MTTYFADVNALIEYGLRGSSDLKRYIIKSINTDYSTGGQQTINAITYYSYYNEG